ncbi:helix-turn-helix domain-containing protein [Pseudomonas pseudonitroreducens]|uniref:helix-turn-helix domain-containing protein n=1 Tax=Pseudomonas pseudonitroreducens TaxID=2892326 RepID=UPI001F1E3A2D|nr:helix-turn-helix domain-containing protein [Pseudomonas pseudonitroreducens]
MTNLTLAEKVEALLAAKMTYRAIAERAGCDTSTVFRIKNGAVVNPSYAVGSAIDLMHSELHQPSKKRRKAA